ncbi:MAG: DUF1353 domain-containing protein [Candidatus Omnitrophota bacterium]|nr:DUF1353 domain-containing protein [Candidatus Omnitrophota bacterium]
MGVYVYCTREEYKHKSSIKNREFENEWFKLEKDGTITVKGVNQNGYAWDGCSPKFLKIADMYFGTPEGVLNLTTGKPKTYYASMIHDILYQFSEKIKHLVKREEADREFYEILKRDGFKSAKCYYWGVKLFGRIWWGRK